ncbi:uncharacterized protein A1O5_05637 [Cladophialophora psammophila CBS 110553]|uniref:Dienelactone hydrolase domain-containing protein n=1 Tax=Cladophialophora psammophila CBS 110553 TaxID=1182543 RepID=W9WR06_9EURO|nr:uncharacterized protein A1O5_05637 [Cladophialophora psammophila CBS 110553]EXJ70647.1 hypothetical protein A1O5_05637 [Cladophialophora psammophila CBS 110553]
MYIVTEDYESRGKFSVLGPLSVYETGSPNENGNILLYCPDGFGHALHNQYLADRFAECGWQVILPDYYEGDPVPLEHLDWDQSKSLEEQGWNEEQLGRMRSFSLDTWLRVHNMTRIQMLLKDCVHAIQQSYPGTSISAIGFCTGGKQSLLLASWAVKAAAIFHPSFVKEEDIHGISVPLYIGLGEKDQMVPSTLKEDLERWLSASKVRGFTISVYPGMDHGWTIRPDNDDPEIRHQCKQAFEDAVKFLSSFKA